MVVVVVVVVVCVMVVLQLQLQLRSPSGVRSRICERGSVTGVVVVNATVVCNCSCTFM